MSWRKGTQEEGGDTARTEGCFFKRESIYSSRQKNSPQNIWRPFVIPPRFERGTYSLEGCRSIQLSYGTLNFQIQAAKIIFL